MWFDVFVFPCLNPTGFELDSLESSSGDNLNRLFGTGSAVAEIRAVERWLADFEGRFAMTFDLHEVNSDYVGESFSEEDNPRACYLYETVSDGSKRIGRQMLSALSPELEVCDWPEIYFDRSHQGLIAYPEDARNVIYAQGTTFDAFLNGRYTGHSFTSETPTGWSMEDRVEPISRWSGRPSSSLRRASDV